MKPNMKCHLEAGSIIAFAACLIGCTSLAQMSAKDPSDTVRATPDPADKTEVRLVINYMGSLFKIADDLARWSPYCEPSVYDYWRSTYTLSEEQVELLDAFGQTRKRTEAGHLEPCFFESEALEEAFACVERRVTPDEAKTVRELVVSLKEDFDRAWLSSSYLLEQRAALEAQFSKIRTDEILSLLYALFDVDSPPKEFRVELLFSPVDDLADGGANGGIFLRYGEHARAGDEVMIIFHEITHRLSEPLTQRLYTLAQNQGLANERDFNVLHEAVVYALFPGFFWEEYLDTPFDFHRQAAELDDKRQDLYRIYRLAGDVYRDVVSRIRTREALDDEFLVLLMDGYAKQIRK